MSDSSSGGCLVAFARKNPAKGRWNCRALPLDRLEWKSHDRIPIMNVLLGPVSTQGPSLGYLKIIFKRFVGKRGHSPAKVVKNGQTAPERAPDTPPMKGLLWDRIPPPHEGPFVGPVELLGIAARLWLSAKGEGSRKNSTVTAKATS